MQRKFLNFHDNIKLNNFDENSTLREKRDLILERVRSKVPKSFEPFNQGSYGMGTGIQPVNGDYDIDVGLIFNIDPYYFNSNTVKTWVFDSLEDYTKRVEFKNPCITVYYTKLGESQYHVDLPIYAKRGNQLFLAVGKRHSANPSWQPSEAKQLISLVAARHSGENAAQFRRVIRYLKRWKNENFSLEGHAAPPGIALTMCAYNWFRPHGAGTSAYFDDLQATIYLVQQIINNFTVTIHDGQYSQRLKAEVPVAPQDDTLRRMTNQKMDEFRRRLNDLKANLDAAKTGQTEPLKRAFWSDFPS